MGQCLIPELLSCSSVRERSWTQFLIFQWAAMASGLGWRMTKGAIALWRLEMWSFLAETRNIAALYYRPEVKPIFDVEKPKEP
jgi:hypothetical protein